MARRQGAASLPVQGYKLTEVTDLTAGVDLRLSLTQLRPSQARRLENWDISNPGRLRPFAGYTQNSASSLGARRIQGADRIYLKRTPATFLLVADNGVLKKPSDAGVWGSDVLTGLNSSNVVSFVHDRDMVAVFDGASVPQKSLDGATWTQFGISAPTVAPTATAVAGGSLLDGSTYGIVYTYYDAGLAYEGNGSTAVTQAVSGANLTVRVTVTASADSQVDTIYVYARNETAGEEVYRRAGSRANSNGTVDLSSENWTQALEVPTDHAVWPAVKFGWVWKNRWWAVDATQGNRLHFSQIFLPQAKPALFYIDLPFEEGDDIQGGMPMGDTLVLWGARNTYLLIGQTSLDFEVRPSLGSVAGVLGPNAAARVESGVIHAAADGIYLFDGASDRLLSLSIETAWRDYVLNATAAELYRTPMVYHQSTKQVRVGVTRLYPTTAAGEWVLFLSRTRDGGREAWGATTRSIGGYVAWSGPETVVGNANRLFSWPLTPALLYEQNVGFSAAGSDQTCVYEGAGLTSGLHWTRFVDTYGEYRVATGALTLDAYVDEMLIATQGLPLVTGGARYDDALYDVDVYASYGRRQWVKNLPLVAEGRTLQLHLRYVGADELELYSYAVGVVPEPAPRGL